MRIGKLFTFEAAHYIPGHEYCGQVHGHSYKLEVILEGDVDNSGMVMDFSEVKKHTNSVIKLLDHKLINDVIPTPTAENIAKMIYLKLKTVMPMLRAVKVWETSTSYAEYS